MSQNFSNKIHKLKNSPTHLAYDIFMMILIIVSLLLIGFDHAINSELVANLADQYHKQNWLQYYNAHIHHKIILADEVLTIFLVVEFFVRWAIAIAGHFYYRWFFFPFVRWYDTLGCFPPLRAVRLVRVVSIAYQLYLMGYHVIPKSWIKTGQFYYSILLEEISDRVIVNVIDGIENELKESRNQRQMIHNLIDRHRTIIAYAVSDVLQDNIQPAILQQQNNIAQFVAQAVKNTVLATPELNTLLNTMPFGSKKLTGLINQVSGQLGKNIAYQLLQPLTEPAPTGEVANPLFKTIAGYVGNISIDSSALEQLVESIVFETLNTVKAQVKVQQWKVKDIAQQHMRQDAGIKE